MQSGLVAGGCIAAVSGGGECLNLISAIHLLSRKLSSVPCSGKQCNIVIIKAYFIIISY
jgi:hypothetical protein